MKELKKQTMLVSAAGLAAGLFAVMAFRKMGIIHFSLTLFLPLLGCLGAVFFWRVWGKLFSRVIKREEIVILKYDAVSFVPFFITLLMFAGKYLHIPKPGKTLLIIAFVMSFWIKVFYAGTLLKGKSRLSSWSLAVPVGFFVALLTQFSFRDFNSARFLVLGQVFALLWAAVFKNFHARRGEG